MRQAKGTIGEKFHILPVAFITFRPTHVKWRDGVEAEWLTPIEQNKHPHTHEGDKSHVREGKTFRKQTLTACSATDRALLAFLREAIKLPRNQSATIVCLQ